MKIFYAGCRYDHFNPKRGASFEHENFYLSLCNLPGVVVTYFPFEQILETEREKPGFGRRRYGEELLAAVKRERPDLVFVFPYSDELSPALLDELARNVMTLAWFADDSWRFYNYSKFLARHFTWVVTTYSYLPELYRVRAGQSNVIRSQWGVDTEVYKPSVPGAGASDAPRPEVSFVGGWTRPRAQIVAGLAARGIKVAAYGGGWEGGRISDAERNHIFSSS
jgi:hypothetical protein